MPYVRQYLIGVGYYFQREVSDEIAAELAPSMGGDLSERPFPGVRMWDDERAIEHARETLRRLMPPHFPDPNADPMAVLSARIMELEEINAAQYAEMVAWRTQLEAANAKLDALGASV